MPRTALLRLGVSPWVLWACLRLTTPGGLSGVRIRNQALVELFDDQVNVVMAGNSAVGPTAAYAACMGQSVSS